MPDTAEDSARGLTATEPADSQTAVPSLRFQGRLLRSLLGTACLVAELTLRLAFIDRVAEERMRTFAHLCSLEATYIHTKHRTGVKTCGWALVQLLTALHPHRPPGSKPLPLATRRARATAQDVKHYNHDSLSPWHKYMNKMVLA